MKKFIVISLAGAMLLSSCSTTESGASNGAFFGSILGSAIGGITGGYRGSDIGTIVGMAGGAVVGAAIGQASEKEEQRKYDEPLFLLLLEFRRQKLLYFGILTLSPMLRTKYSARLNNCGKCIQKSRDN